MKKWLLLSAALLALNGCAHVVSRANLEKADRSISVADLIKKPEKYKGKIVILGGNIVNSLNKNDGTYIEVLHKKLDSLGRPVESNETLGRFIVFHEGYLDTAIFAKGRRLTVAGEVIGQKKLPLGEIEYKYPLIKSMELHMTDPRQEPTIRLGIGIGGTF
ncbi:MAG: Slp family lipoprotein [Deltaproteobacteria bacterium]|nr:Slp family lipoprotein [Deltaproteobacteria bacterium]